MTTEENTSALVLVRIPASDLELDFTIPSDAGLYTQTLKSIYTAWTSSAIIDQRGAVWVRTSKLHTILRTTRVLARYYLDIIADEHKVKVRGEMYVKGSEVCRLIDNAVQSSSSLRREGYARYSDYLYREIRDSDKARLVRAEYYEYIRRYRSELKRTRIARFDVTTDELTGLPLYKTGTQFSHIRSVGAYLDMADKIWNGLVVNQQTHKIITNNDVNDEDQLLNLCIEYGWNTDWYSEFLNSLNSYRNG